MYIERNRVFSERGLIPNKVFKFINSGYLTSRHRACVSLPLRIFSDLDFVQRGTIWQYVKQLNFCLNTKPLQSSYKSNLYDNFMNKKER